MREDYNDEEWQNARALVQRLMDEVRLTDAATQSPKAVAEAMAIFAGASWQMGYDDPDFEKLRAFLVEQMSGAARLKTVRSLNPDKRKK